MMGRGIAGKCEVAGVTVGSLGRSLRMCTEMAGSDPVTVIEFRS